VSASFSPSFSSAAKSPANSTLRASRRST
jgi:hypothetical protein